MTWLGPLPALAGRRQMDERQAWLQQNAVRLETLRAEVLALLGTDDGDPRHQPKLAEIRRELKNLEHLWRVVKEGWER
jgi:hypothetical protein